MTEKSTIYFHLGLPKTASTYLQQIVFPQLEGITFHKKHDFRKYHDIQKGIEQKHIFSSEMDNGIEYEMRKIKEIHPGASIIIVFRSHFSWILSKYKYSIRKWNHLHMAEYYSTSDDKVLQVPDNYYQSIIELADRLFDGRILVVNYHHLRSMPGSVERQLQKFMDLPFNPIRQGKTVNKAFFYSPVNKCQEIQSTTHIPRIKDAFSGLQKITLQVSAISLACYCFLFKIHSGE